MAPVMYIIGVSIFGCTMAWVLYQLRGPISSLISDDTSLEVRLTLILAASIMALAAFILLMGFVKLI